MQASIDSIVSFFQRVQSVPHHGERSDWDAIQPKKRTHAKATDKVRCKRWLSPDRRITGVPGKTSGVPWMPCDHFQPLPSGVHFLAKSLRFVRTVKA